MELYWPASQGEWMAWLSAAITVVFGLILLFAPRVALKFLRLQTKPERPEALSEIRGTFAGFYLGLGLSALVFAQPFLWIALGVSWGFTVFGRLISMMSDRGNTLYNWISVIIELALAAGPLLFAFGFVA
jgi:cytochrome c biogenesis protein CcdA